MRKFEAGVTELCETGLKGEGSVGSEGGTCERER